MARGAGDKAAGGGAGEPRNTVRLGPGIELPEVSLRYTATRSSGPGGQNVNKRSTRVELRVSSVELREAGLTPGAVKRLKRLAGRRSIVELEAEAVPEDDAASEPAVGPLEVPFEVLIVSQEERTQLRNKQRCLERLTELVLRAKTPPKVRRKTKPSRGAVERRLQAKREQGEKKKRRREGRG